MMASEAQGENERALFSQEAIKTRYRELDEREIRLDERDKRVTVREADAGTHERLADERDEKADVREREDIQQRVRADREGR